MRQRITALAAFIAALAIFALPGGGHAEDLNEAKAAGQVGERYDGYLGIVNDAAPVEVKALVEEINTKRREKYEDVAKKNNVQVEKVQGVAGKKLIESTKGGQFVLPPKTEGWKQKTEAPKP